MHKNPNKFYISNILLFIPAFAFANAGSPMMWFGMLHLAVLNALIGISESLILNRFNIQNRMWLIILGNYASMIIGMHYIAPYFSNLSGNRDFWGGQTNYGEYNYDGFYAGMTASFIATLIIEYIFFYLAVKDKSKRKSLSLPYFIANLATNSIMFALYYWVNM